MGNGIIAADMNIMLDSVLRIGALQARSRLGASIRNHSYQVRGLSKKFVQYVYKNVLIQILGYINVVPFKILPIRHNTLSHLRFHCWKHPWNSSSLQPFSSDVISL